MPADQSSDSRSEALRASPRMFDSPFLDRLSRVHPAVVPLIFVPAIAVLAVAAWPSLEPRWTHLRLGGRGLVLLDAHRVLDAPGGLPLRAREGLRGAPALDHPRRPSRPPQRSDAPGHAAVGEHPAGHRVLPALRLLARGRPRPGLRVRLPARVPRLRHDALPRASPHPDARRSGRRCASSTCVTTSRTTRAATGSARRSGTSSSAPHRSAAAAPRSNLPPQCPASVSPPPRSRWPPSLPARPPPLPPARSPGRRPSSAPASTWTARGERPPTSTSPTVRSRAARPGAWTAGAPPTGRTSPSGSARAHGSSAPPSCGSCPGAGTPHTTASSSAASARRPAGACGWRSSPGCGSISTAAARPRPPRSPTAR